MSTRAFLLFAALIVMTRPALAQNVIMTPQVEPALAQYLRRQNAPPPPSQEPIPPLTPYMVGNIALHPRASYQYMMSEGVPIRAGVRADTEVHTVRLGVSGDLSDHWAFDYSPSWVYYSGSALEDSFEQSASLSGAYALQHWTFELTQSYSQTNQTLIETAQQTELESFTTNLGAFFSYSPKLQIRSNLSLNTRDTSIGTDIRSWSIQSGINYQVSTRLGVSLIPGYTYTEIENGPDTYGESYTGQVTWHPVNKITVGFGAGMKSTNTTASNGNRLSRPQMNFSLSYRIFETTSLSLAASRSTSPSYFVQQETENYRWNFNLNQRLLGRFYLNAGYARQDNSYIVLSSNLPTVRDDKVESYSLRLSTKLFSRISASANFQKSKNNSTLTGFSFSSTQYGAQLSYQY